MLSLLNLDEIMIDDNVLKAIDMNAFYFHYTGRVLSIRNRLQHQSDTKVIVTWPRSQKLS